ncbi:hypothetical protein [Lactiplantibacillus modestisalitolerans]|uniref:Integral membrane protein n=1 Tax=Lactiplantibacillus modestisalitolerans TaxID=1457219 RepID=A0ABV5WX19_9LACO|nr:hypothetical protein [Lactiplantibacillus modestisalitolerans]
MKAILLNNLVALLVLIGIPGGFAGLLTVLNRRSKRNLVNRFGVNSQVYCGALGIVIHELSHLIVAVLFRHGIQSVRLIKRPHLTAGSDDDLALGYVNHTWQAGNYYQVIGNLFIGVAPIFGCTAALLGLDYWLWPGLARAIMHLAATPTVLDWTGSWHLILTTPTSVGRLILLAGLSLMIVLGGFDLSPADYQNSAVGLYSTLATIIVGTSLLTWLGITTWLQGLIQWGVTLTIILGYAVVLSLLVALASRLLVRR